ncbi:malonyl-ACP O-methyltransferase BioC [Kaarinaea lacus]
MSDNSEQYLLDKKLIRLSFDAAADQYDDVAFLQREVGQRIIDRLEFIKLSPHTILDVGSGTGYVSQGLKQYFKKSRIISLDIAPRMLKVARSKNNWFSQWVGNHAFVCGDAESLPLNDNSIDLIFSNLTLQWCGELDQVFSEFRRVLKPDGLLMFSTFGPDTLKELRQSWHIADTNTGEAGDSLHVNQFIDMHDIGDALLRTGLSDPVMDVEHFTLTYPDVYKLMRELKTLGAHNVAKGRRHGLTGKQRMKKMVAAYEKFRINGVLPATYEVVYGHAWQSSKSQAFEVPMKTLPVSGPR